MLESVTISYFSRLGIKHLLKPVMEDKDEGVSKHLNKDKKVHCGVGWRGKSYKQETT